MLISRIEQALQPVSTFVSLESFNYNRHSQKTGLSVLSRRPATASVPSCCLSARKLHGRRTPYFYRRFANAIQTLNASNLNPGQPGNTLSCQSYRKRHRTGPQEIPTHVKEDSQT